MGNEYKICDKTQMLHIDLVNHAVKMIADTKTVIVLRIESTILHDSIKTSIRNSFIKQIKKEE
jgi:hypothetical protein